MPELPEVETIRRGLIAKVKGKKIAQFEVRLERMLQNGKLDEFKKVTEGATIDDIKRRAKVLVFNLSSGLSLLIHLKMSGQLIYSSPSTPLEKYTHVIFHFSDGNQLRFNDFRQFGYVKLVKGTALEEIAELHDFGPEPLDEKFTLEVFKSLLAKKPRAKIKPLLMDQAFIAGIGNLYADEILWLAQVKPTRVVNALKDDEKIRIFEGIKKILLEAISHRGSSVDAYIDVDGKQGGHEPYLKAYRQNGKPCPRCGAIIERIKLGGRGTHFCPSCQH